MEVFLMRHAHAVDASEWAHGGDTRPLTQKGRDRARRVGQGLARLDAPPTLIVSSPLDRALQTATIVGQELGVSVAVSEAIGPGLDLARLNLALSTAPEDQRPLIVGHEPDLTGLVLRMARADTAPPQGFQMKRASCCLLVTPGRGPAGTSEWKGRCALRWFRRWREWDG